MKVKEKSEKACLKLNIQKTKIMASGPITSWQIVGKQWKLRDFIFGAPESLQIVTTAMRLKDACSLKETLLTKVRLVKAMVFPVVMYGCESWTIKKAECQRIDAFELWCWRRVESPLDCKEIQPVHPIGDQSRMFIGRTDAEAETPILWPPDGKN